MIRPDSLNFFTGDQITCIACGPMGRPGRTMITRPVTEGGSAWAARSSDRDEGLGVPHPISDNNRSPGGKVARCNRTQPVEWNYQQQIGAIAEMTLSGPPVPHPVTDNTRGTAYRLMQTQPVKWPYRQQIGDLSGSWGFCWPPWDCPDRTLYYADPPNSVNESPSIREFIDIRAKVQGRGNRVGDLRQVAAAYVKLATDVWQSSAWESMTSTGWVFAFNDITSKIANDTPMGNPLRANVAIAVDASNCLKAHVAVFDKNQTPDDAVDSNSEELWRCAERIALCNAGLAEIKLTMSNAMKLLVKEIQPTPKNIWNAIPGWVWATVGGGVGLYLFGPYIVRRMRSGLQGFGINRSRRPRRRSVR